MYLRTKKQQFEGAMKKQSNETLEDHARYIEEVLKCKADPIYFFENYVKIKHPRRGVIPFKVWEFQRDTVDKFIKYRRVIVLKSRQLGISWAYAAYVAWRALFHKAQEILIVANVGKTASSMMSRIIFIIDNLPDWMFNHSDKKTIPIRNRTSITLFNDSHIQATTTTSDSGVGESLSLLVIDEAAVIPHNKAEELWTTIEPTIEVGGDVIIVSTPRSEGHWFHEMWLGSCRKRKVNPKTGKKDGTGENGFYPVTLGWEVHPDRDVKWAKAKIKKIGKTRFKREYACEFVGSGTTMFEYDEIVAHENVYVREPIRKEKYIATPEPDIWIWEDPQPQAKYFFTIDCSRAETEGSDFATWSVFKVPEIYDPLGAMVQVAEYCGHMLPDEFFNMCYDWACKYNNAFVACEKNSMGTGINVDFARKYYYNIWYDLTDKSRGNPNVKQEYKPIPGIDTTANTRKAYINRFYNDFRSGKIVIRSSRSIKQLKSFVWNGKRYEASSGNHDDLVIPIGIACYMQHDLQDREMGNRLLLNFMMQGMKINSRTDSSLFVVRGNQRPGQTHNPDQLKQNNYGWLFDDPTSRQRYRNEDDGW